MNFYLGDFQREHPRETVYIEHRYVNGRIVDKIIIHSRKSIFCNPLYNRYIKDRQYVFTNENFQNEIDNGGNTINNDNNYYLLNLDLRNRTTVCKNLSFTIYKTICLAALYFLVSLIYTIYYKDILLVPSIFVCIVTLSLRTLHIECVAATYLTALIIGLTYLYLAGMLLVSLLISQSVLFIRKEAVNNLTKTLINRSEIITSNNLVNISTENLAFLLLLSLINTFVFFSVCHNARLISTILDISVKEELFDLTLPFTNDGTGRKIQIVNSTDNLLETVANKNFITNYLIINNCKPQNDIAHINRFSVAEKIDTGKEDYKYKNSKNIYTKSKNKYFTITNTLYGVWNDFRSVISLKIANENYRDIDILDSLTKSSSSKHEIPEINPIFFDSSLNNSENKIDLNDINNISSDILKFIRKKKPNFKISFSNLNYLYLSRNISSGQFFTGHKRNNNEELKILKFESIKKNLFDEISDIYAFLNDSFYDYGKIISENNNYNNNGTHSYNESNFFYFLIKIDALTNKNQKKITKIRLKALSDLCNSIVDYCNRKQAIKAFKFFIKTRSGRIIRKEIRKYYQEYS